MKKHNVKRVIFLILTGVLFMNLFSACGKPKYKLNLDGSFKSKKAAYAAGEKVTVYYDIIGTDTDYSFCSDDVELRQSYSERKGYILSFVMPAHDVTLHVRATNSMMYIPPEPVLTIGETAVPVTWENNDSVRALLASGYMAWDKDDIETAAKKFRQAADKSPYSCLPLLKSLAIYAFKKDYNQ